MPPANSPTETPVSSSETGSPYLQQLEVISSPVPNLAATLITQPENDRSDGSMSYLRTRLPDSPDRTLSRTERTRQPYLTEDEFRNFTSESRRRLLRNLDLGRRIPIARPVLYDEDSESNYANRIPQRQSLYDWAPGSEDEEEDHGPPSYRFDLLNRSSEHLLLPLQEQTHLRSIQRSVEAQRVVRSRPRREPRDEPSGRATLPYWAEHHRNESLLPSSEQSLSATAALLQSVERHRRYNARARSTMQGFILDRDRLNHEGATREVTSSRLHRSENTRGPSPYSHSFGHNLSSHRDLRAAYRQMFDDKPSLTRLKHMIRYLSDLRHCSNNIEGESLAAHLDFGTLYLIMKPLGNPDIIMDLALLPPPQPSSFLMPGTVFCGSQHSPQDLPTLTLSLDREHITRLPDTSANLDPHSSENVPLSLASSGRYARGLHSQLPHVTSNFINATSTQALRSLDHWPVRVALHAVDLESMTLSGTMSASHIPDKSSPSLPGHRAEGSSMRSYFEGEIVDFRKFALETESFRSDGIETDVTYWRHVGPFKEVCRRMEEKGGDGEEEMVRCLASPKWLERVLGREWVLMRWKERCFLTESDSGWGLTISGFYYIAMKRDTGQIDGLYYDPGSQPYQQLSMMPEGMKEGSKVGIKRQWPAYEFR